jgi:hypothetical protein
MDRLERIERIERIERLERMERMERHERAEHERAVAVERERAAERPMEVRKPALWNLIAAADRDDWRGLKRQRTEVTSLW